MQRREAPRVDWFQVIIGLERAGYSHSAISAAIGAPKSTVQGWKQGAEPKHSDGENVISLWCQVTGLKREQLPTIGRYDFRA